MSGVASVRPRKRPPLSKPPLSPSEEAGGERYTRSEPIVGRSYDAASSALCHFLSGLSDRRGVGTSLYVLASANSG